MLKYAPAAMATTFFPAKRPDTTTGLVFEAALAPF
jgi:hypothetical protein